MQRSDFAGVVRRLVGLSRSSARAGETPGQKYHCSVASHADLMCLAKEHQVLCFRARASASNIAIVRLMNGHHPQNASIQVYLYVICFALKRPVSVFAVAAAHRESANMQGGREDSWTAHSSHLLRRVGVAKLRIHSGG